jgi:hypothetical protein
MTHTTTIQELISSSVARKKAQKKRKMNSAAKSILWRIAALPKKKSEELCNATGCTEKYWFNTTGAAFYCLCKTGDSNIDWHSLLQENRRCQYDKIDVKVFGKKPRGNVERLSELVKFTIKRKVYYTSLHLDIWLDEYLSRKARS